MMTQVFSRNLAQKMEQQCAAGFQERDMAQAGFFVSRSLRQIGPKLRHGEGDPGEAGHNSIGQQVLA